ncbi:hypothetical protein BCR42DRAFT_497406 [Absidia repens]|uniref:Heterokaryon incompatibility domain-containing protein n=1 Tax=Absidia repens TaxID=90262 RepID=A0A1X2HDS8_9FUNG|nr:hypothetical protein BCR42DRAFT_497406 [Absidia repens]
MIHCVKKPLEENDLKFVALSYRWGELHETLIDTGVGYTATITSFDLNDFYRLCEMMTIESDTKHINYVWVDAICVDQSPAKRKATIHQMSNIYDRATYILAVPDLHVTYLKGVSFKNETPSRAPANTIWIFITFFTDMRPNSTPWMKHSSMMPSAKRSSCIKTIAA